MLCTACNKERHVADLTSSGSSTCGRNVFFLPQIALCGTVPFKIRDQLGRLWPFFSLITMAESTVLADSVVLPPTLPGWFPRLPQRFPDF
jgi:hypothetical protein